MFKMSIIVMCNSSNLILNKDGPEFFSSNENFVYKAI